MFVDPLKKYVRERTVADDIRDIVDEQYDRIIREAKMRPEQTLVFAVFEGEDFDHENEYYAAHDLQIYFRDHFGFWSNCIKKYSKEGIIEKATFTVTYVRPWFIRMWDKKNA